MKRNPFSWLQIAGDFVLSLNATGRISACVIVVWLVATLFGPQLAPHGMEEYVNADIFAPIGPHFPMGTDYMGRDMLSRVLIATHYTVGLSLAGALLASGVGASLALLAVVKGKWIDEALSRIADIVLVTPNKILALLMIAVFGSSVPVLILTVAGTFTPGAFRVARALAVNVNANEFVTVARLRGESAWHLARRELLPNILHGVLADFGLRFVYVVLTLSALSFLGLGVQPPAADWGALARENLSALQEGAAAVVMPALALASLTVSVNLFIDSLAVRRVRAPRHAEAT
jgi:peptide/nickel transport system permease protein